jgi:hypothetical protein
LVLLAAGRNMFLFSRASRPAWSPITPHFPIQWILGALSMGLKRPGPEVEIVWSYNHIPSYAVVVWCLIKRRNNCDFVNENKTI